MNETSKVPATPQRRSQPLPSASGTGSPSHGGSNHGGGGGFSAFVNYGRRGSSGSSSSGGGGGYRSMNRNSRAVSSSRSRLFNPQAMPQQHQQQQQRPLSPVSQARKLLAERGTLLLSTTMDEDDTEAALYTEVVLSDDEMADNYLEADDDDDGDADDDESDDGTAMAAQPYLSSPPPPSRNHSINKNNNSSTNETIEAWSLPPQLLSSSKPASRSPRRMRPSSFDGIDELIRRRNGGGGASGSFTLDEDQEEEEFRIRHWLKDHHRQQGGGATSAAATSSSTSPTATAVAMMSAPPPPPSLRDPSPVSLRPSWHRGLSSRTTMGSSVEDALFVEDKPWRSHRRQQSQPSPSKTRNFATQQHLLPNLDHQSQEQQQQQQQQLILSPQSQQQPGPQQQQQQQPPQEKRGSLLGYIRNKLPRRSDSRSVSSAAAANYASDEDGAATDVPFSNLSSHQFAGNRLVPRSPLRTRTRSSGDSAHTPSGFANKVDDDDDDDDDEEEEYDEDDHIVETDSMEGHDLIVEAASSVGSSLGGGGGGDYNYDKNNNDKNNNLNNESLNDEWNDFMLDDEDDDDDCFGWERPVEWKMLAECQMPTHFCSDSSSSPGVKGSTAAVPSSANFSLQRASHFVWQHGMLLNAVLQLLMERDHLGDEGSADDSDNIWKKGPLKKMTTGKGPMKWKVKYVEVRRGNLCYYEDSGVESGRKMIHLRSRDTSVNQRLEHHHHAKQTSLYVFEVVQSGSPKYVWAARSDEERQAWIRAIQVAMIGNGGINNGNDAATVVAERDFVAHHQVGIDRYRALRAKLKEMDVHEDYEAEVKKALRGGDGTSSSSSNRRPSFTPLQIPVSWIRLQVQDLGGRNAMSNHSSNSNFNTGSGNPVPDRFNPRLTSNGADPQKQIRSSIAEFWNKMKETAFAVNGLVIPRDMTFCTERVFGSLTRCILEYDHAFVRGMNLSTEFDQQLILSKTSGHHQNPMSNDKSTIDSSTQMVSELQAVTYARDVLVAVLRTREQHDVLYAVNDLLRNDDLVVVSAKEDEDIVHLEVSFAGDDWKDYEQPEIAVKDNTISQWLHTKRSVGWRRRFAVLSGVVLSYYESASPRPHGLKGQLVLDQASLVATPTESNNSNNNANTNAAKTEGGETQQQPQPNQRRHVLIVATKTETRYLSFETDKEMLEWQAALQNAIDSCNSSDRDPKQDERQKQKEKSSGGGKKKFRATGSQIIKSSRKGVIKSAKDGMKVVFGKKTKQQQQQLQQQQQEQQQHLLQAEGGNDGVAGTNNPRNLYDDEIMCNEEEDEEEATVFTDIPKRPSVQALMDSTITKGAGRREQTVQCVVQHLHRFVVRDRFNTLNAGGGGGSGSANSHHDDDDDDDDEEDGALLTISAKLFQAFMISGGPNGRLSRGNALVEIDIAGDHRYVQFQEMNGVLV